MIRAWCAAALLLLGVAPAQAQTLGDSHAAVDEPMARPAGDRLVWADEFDRPGLPDARHWHYDTSRNRAGWYNDEKQYYAAARPENARVAGGNLVITARAERLTGRSDYGGQDYSSARLDLSPGGGWTYGFLEVRAKLPCGGGVWPAIWMLAADPAAGWPAGGEIDVMEHVGWQPGVIHGTIHTDAYNHVKQTQRGASTTIPDACGAFHRYQLDWTPDHLRIGVDDRAFMRFDNDHRDDPKTWPFDKPQSLILNVAVGGWGAQQGGIDPAAFPATMLVDYVRFWQPR